MQYMVSELLPRDKRMQDKLDALLLQEGIRRDENLTYIAGIFDENYQLLAAGGYFRNTLRSLVVDSSRQGEGLMAQIVSHLTAQALAEGYGHLFLYTKCENMGIFSDLGFYEVARIPNTLVLMENRRQGFASFLENLAPYKKEGDIAALVMNCNPFTLGHRYLIERTAAENTWVHLFVVSEDESLVPFADRFQLVKEGTSDLKNVILHQTGSYMISTAVFPSYFLKEEEAAIEIQAKLDIEIFKQIAKILGIQKRYVGEEPFSLVTDIYNRVMGESLADSNITQTVIPRKEEGGTAISASRVRQLLCEGKLEAIKELVPQSTFAYFKTPAGEETIKAIQKSEHVVHY